MLMYCRNISRDSLEVLPNLSDCLRTGLAGQWPQTLRLCCTFFSTRSLRQVWSLDHWLTTKHTSSHLFHIIYIIYYLHNAPSLYFEVNSTGPYSTVRALLFMLMFQNIGPIESKLPWKVRLIFDIEAIYFSVETADITKIIYSLISEIITSDTSCRRKASAIRITMENCRWS